MLKLSVSVDESWTGASQRAAEDVAAGRVAALVAPGVYEIASSSEPGATHTVRILNVGRLEASCDCRFAQSGRKGHCRHVAQALDCEVRRVSRKPAANAAPIAPAIPRAPEPAVAPAAPETPAAWLRRMAARA